MKVCVYSDLKLPMSFLHTVVKHLDLLIVLISFKTDILHFCIVIYLGLLMCFSCSMQHYFQTCSVCLRLSRSCEVAPNQVSREFQSTKLSEVFSYKIWLLK